MYLFLKILSLKISITFIIKRDFQIIYFYKWFKFLC